MKTQNIPSKVIDHAFSKETFELRYNSEYDMLETHPQLPSEKLQEYYKSDDYISHTDAKRSLFEHLYHLVRGHTMKQKLKLINSFRFKERTLLDIGCGTGDFILEANNNAWKVVGIEPNKKAREIAQKKVNNSVFNIDELNTLNKQSFNVITLWHVLEHLPELEKHIALFKRLLKPEGRLIIAVPNYKSFDASYYKSYWAAYDVPRHLWHFSKTSIERLFDEQHMLIEKIRPMKMDAYYVSLLSEKYKSGWMNFFKAFFVASRSNLKASSTGNYSSLIYIIKNT